MEKEKEIRLNWIPWGLTAVFLLILLLLSQIGWWQTVAAGAQVQVPMFYDAHYLFPRPWTQEQVAPGVPEPFPVALYETNVIRQPFVTAANEITAVSIWLAGASQTSVSLTLADAAGNSQSGIVKLRHGLEGGWYHFQTSVNVPVGSELVVTLSAPEATSQQPVVVRTVGGDRLGGAVYLNEFPRPGNVQLRVYGRNMLNALEVQLLPLPFQTRIPQYKPEPLKNNFGWLLGATAVLSLLFLLLALPRKRPFFSTLGWLLAALLGGLLLWQASSGRLLLPLLASTVELAPTANQPTPTSGSQPRLLHDLTLLLWAAERKPEPRAIATELAEGHPTITTPATAQLGFPIEVPPNALLRFGLQGASPAAYAIWFNDTTLWQADEVANGELVWHEVDLTPLAGQSGQLVLQTEGSHGQARWVQPQILAQTNWILAELPALPPLGVRFNNAVQLAAAALPITPIAAGDLLPVTFYWQAERSSLPQATMFIHLLNEVGEIVVQQDAPPLGGAYPTSVWQAGNIIEDFRQLSLPPDLAAGSYRLAVGLYDPTTFVRWTALTAAGEPVLDDRLVLETAVIITE